MKRTLLAAALLAIPGLANAGLSFQELSSATRSEAFDVANMQSFAVNTTLKLGSLITDVAGTVSFTYLGQESGYDDSFHLTIPPTQHLYESNAVGTTVSAFVGGPGAISFKFEGDTGKFAVNGGIWSAGTSIGLIGQNMTISQGGGAGTYAFVLGYNDSAGAATLGDWDDFVVGVNFTPSQVMAPVPEPEIYAMMGLGLGLMGWMGRRKKLKEA